MTKYSKYGQVSDDFGADNVRCDGTENHLSECSYSSRDDCGGTEGAGVVCDTRTLAEIEKETACFEDGVSYYNGKYLLIGYVDRLVGEKKILFL